MDEKIITIFGSGKANEADGDYKVAFELGTELAQAGFTIANGGYGGTMEAAAKGANRQGGQVIGVTCRVFGSSANEYVTSRLSTDSLEERLRKLIEIADAFVVLPGSTGTLLELAKVWEFKNKGFLQADKPVIILGEFWEPLLSLIAAKDSKSRKYLKVLNSAEEVKNYLLNTFSN